MASAIPAHCQSSTHPPVPCEVLNAAGRWVSGYELLAFCDNGLLSIRSIHTGAVRQLPIDQWRDPVEEAIASSWN